MDSSIDSSDNQDAASSANHSTASDSDSSVQSAQLNGNNGSNAESAETVREDGEGFMLGKIKPQHNWNVIAACNKRSLGISSHKNLENVFNMKCYGSLRFVQRLELAYKMDCHNGCVNTLHFNASGTKLASGSDDLNIIVWDWTHAEPVINYESGHRGNVFQAKFLPFHGDTHIVSCARDGQVRLAELSSTGVCHSTRRLGQHRGPAHKLALLMDTPHIFFTAGEDGVILEIDVRQNKPNKILTVKQGERKIALYSIAAHPLDVNELCVGGRDQFVRIYDRRKIGDEDSLLKKLCPNHLVDSSIRAHVTSAVYSFNGADIVASYNDEDIYSFSSHADDGTDYKHRYTGHRNNATVKGVNFYGPKSEFVVSGSDCGNIFFWDAETEAIVQCVSGDENGVVNCLEPHPGIPALATSGLDDDVKIWMPNGSEEPKLRNIKSTVRTNHQEREDERRREPDTIDGELLWVVWRHLRRTERRRGQSRRSANHDTAGHSTHSSDDSDESESEDGPRGVQCAPS